MEKAKLILQLNHELEEKLKDITGNYSGRIRIGVQLRRANGFLPPIIAAYEKEFPGVEVILKEGVMSELKESIQNFKLDLLLCSRMDLPPYMESFVLFREHLFDRGSQRTSHQPEGSSGRGESFPKSGSFLPERGKTYTCKAETEYTSGCGPDLK